MKKSGVRGENHGSCKLSESQIREIFHRAHSEPHRKLAKAFGVHTSTITNIKGGRRWRHLNLRHAKQGDPDD